MANTAQLAAQLTTEVQGGDVPPARFGHSVTAIGGGIIILFGGAVGDSGSYTITNDCYQLDMTTMKWTKLTATWTPQARAAHGAARVESMQLVLYGGATGGGSLSSEELYLLDVRRSPSTTWMTVPITGTTPGRRYGHSMVYGKPNLIVFGGNDGQHCLNDIFFMHVERCPFVWIQVQLPPNARAPPERVYHSAEICREGPANGMMVIFGGRAGDNSGLRDIWGLRQHRNGQWDWVVAPVKRGTHPDARYQHSAIFMGPKMVILGGRESDVSHSLPTAVYDTEACDWKFLSPLGRFRHASWSHGDSVYTFGGFNHQTQSSPTLDLQRLCLSDLSSAYFDPMQRSAERSRTSLNVPSSDPRSTSTPAVSGVRLANHVISNTPDPARGDFSTLVRKLSIDRLNQEGKKIKGHATPLHPGHMLPAATDPGDHLTNKFIHRLLRPDVSFRTLERDFPKQAQFSIPAHDVKVLIARAQEIFKQEPMLLRLRAPIKVYGDIHGQYYDLMRMFASYKCPIEEQIRDEYAFSPDSNVNGDIDAVDYLFLGDFVDRGTHSLEVMCLLLALKVKYPKQVHLIRGNHEDPAINASYGFKEECQRRLVEDPEAPDSCWRKFNTLFEWLPVAAIIEDRIICLHGGIGGSINLLTDISELPRPLTVQQVPTTPMDQKVTDLLWSDPTDNDSIVGVVPNDVRDPEGCGHIVRYGPDRVIEFIQKNDLDLIIRAHECVLDGFERFAGGRLITLFSATDYCGNHKNAGALLFIRRDLTIVPKIIHSHPVEPEYNSKTWLMDSSRPPTPPRNMRRAMIDPL